MSLESDVSRISGWSYWYAKDLNRLRETIAKNDETNVRVTIENTKNPSLGIDEWSLKVGRGDVDVKTLASSLDNRHAAIGKALEFMKKYKRPYWEDRYLYDEDGSMLTSI